MKDTRTQAQIARENGITRQAVHQRIKAGKPVDGPPVKADPEIAAAAKAVGISECGIRSRKLRGSPIYAPKHSGRPFSVVRQLAEEYGISESTVRHRMAMGLPLNAPAIRGAKGPRKCKRCGVLGHMAKTCKAPAE